MPASGRSERTLSFARRWSRHPWSAPSSGAGAVPTWTRALRSIPGVGVWTAAETMQRAHGDPDSPSVGDYHLPSIVGLALAGEAVDDAGMLELLQPWAGHRHRIVRLIEHSGFTKPRHGPRMSVQDHRGH